MLCLFGRVQTCKKNVFSDLYFIVSDIVAPLKKIRFVKITFFYSERFDHNSDNDHTDDVTGVASCHKMRLFASSSLDGSVRIWDESNHLLRVITLNALPTCLSFCSQKGDLLVGIGNHLHKIEYAMCK
jgi:WD40 repeat protein